MSVDLSGAPQHSKLASVVDLDPELPRVWRAE